MEGLLHSDCFHGNEGLVKSELKESLELSEL